MTTPSSGRISIQDVENVFNHTYGGILYRIDRLSRMYSLAPSIPTNGRISLDDMYSKTTQSPSLSLSSNSASYTTNGTTPTSGSFTFNASDLYQLQV